MTRIAIVGAGIAGLTCADLLHPQLENQANDVVLHTDAALAPGPPPRLASWNFHLQEQLAGAPP